MHHTADPPKPYVTNLFRSISIEMLLGRVGRTNDSQVMICFKRPQEAGEHMPLPEMDLAE